MCQHEAARGERWVKIDGQRGPMFFCPEHRFELGTLIGKVEPIDILKFEQEYTKEETAEEQLPGCFREYGVAGDVCKPTDQGGACHYWVECRDSTHGGERAQSEAEKEARQPIDKPKPKIKIRPVEE
jgi:hypothetical protein